MAKQTNSNSQTRKFDAGAVRNRGESDKPKIAAKHERDLAKLDRQGLKKG
jgi:hypothetical protein